MQFVAVPDQPGNPLQTCNRIVNLRPLTLTKPVPHSSKVLIQDRLVGEVLFDDNVQHRV